MRNYHTLDIEELVPVLSGTCLYLFRLELIDFLFFRCFLSRGLGDVLSTGFRSCFGETGTFSVLGRSRSWMLHGGTSLTITSHHGVTIDRQIEMIRVIASSQFPN